MERGVYIRYWRMDKADCLSRGVLLSPHLGDWMHDGHPSSQAHSAIVWRVAFRSSLKCAYAADIDPVAHGVDRHHANHGVLQPAERRITSLRT